MFEIRTEGVPIKLWLDTLEEGALAQAKNIANLPYAYHHVAIMPDAHQGFGMPIGGVLATTDAVIPNAVGVDIGCGMNAVQTSLEGISHDKLQKIVDELRSLIPVGFKHHKTQQQWEGFDEAPPTKVVQQELDSARYQLGTLGGGNHFIELQQGSDGRVWIMLHSGSRNFGYTIAKEYYRRAKDQLNKELKEKLPDIQLAPLFLGSPTANEYFASMQFAQEFAAASRAHMLHTVQSVLKRYYPRVSFGEEVNIHHNFAALEQHFGREVVVHRKGATSARKGQRGIVPGSQGTHSYIVEGLGNPESFCSCSHGAGRVMGRKAAQRSLDLQKERSRMDRQGILHNLRSSKDLDEAAGAYKNISDVMEHQRDLVKILVELSPLAVIKG
ncbi:MAG: RtcB family protein [Spirochaetaceae bacterium]|nr:RtcB family protein [Spirochaetaceae bacterium]MCF7948017.1 RtcB family protein [Spirochaetia bacterium]MCF7951117.1 RtcB family protein [Spirochaetaceae bacterium]